jgi:hypothetical protein
VDLFYLIQKSNNVFGQSDIFFSLLLSSFVFIERKGKKSIFEVLGRV